MCWNIHLHQTAIFHNKPHLPLSLPQWGVWMRLHVAFQPILARKFLETHWTTINFILGLLLSFTTLQFLHGLFGREGRILSRKNLNERTNSHGAWFQPLWVALNLPFVLPKTKYSPPHRIWTHKGRRVPCYVSTSKKTAFREGGRCQPWNLRDSEKNNSIFNQQSLIRTADIKMLYSMRFASLKLFLWHPLFRSATAEMEMIIRTFGFPLCLSAQ